MFQYASTGIVPACSGFVRADHRGTLSPMTSVPHQCPPYSPPPYQDVGHFTRSHDTNEWNCTLKPREPLLNKSHKPSESSDPYNFRFSSSTGSSSRHLRSQSTSFNWYKLAQYTSDVALHQELQWHHTWTPRSSGLHWDVIRPPTATKALSPRYNIVVPDFDSPALHKPVERPELWSDHPVLACYMRELNWGSVPMGVNPTVLELIQSIYDYLTTPLKDNDLRYVYSTPQNGKLLERARQSRAEEGCYAINDVEHKGPFRRSDVLGSHRCFQGIRAVKMRDGKDVFFFNLGPGHVPRY